MPKAGSGWYFNLTNDLPVAGGHQDVRVIKKKYRLQPILKYHNCNVGRPLLSKLTLLFIPHLAGNTFVVKTHAGPTLSLKFLLGKGAAAATHIFRDPRDILVSAYEHGKWIRAAGETHSFARLDSFDKAVSATLEWLNIWHRWNETENVHSTRYESLLEDPVREMRSLARIIDLNVAQSDIRDIVSFYDKGTRGEKENADPSGALHLNEGVAGRHRIALTEDQLEICNQTFGRHLERMGYPT